jgi:hypothetical protein
VGLPLVASALGLPLFDLPIMPQRSRSSTGSLDVTQQLAPYEQPLPSPQVFVQSQNVCLIGLAKFATEQPVACSQRQERAVSHFQPGWTDCRGLACRHSDVLCQHSNRVGEVRQAAWPRRLLPCRQRSSMLVKGVLAALPARPSASQTASHVIVFVWSTICRVPSFNRKRSTSDFAVVPISATTSSLPLSPFSAASHW